MSDDVLCPCEECEDARIEATRDTELATLREQLADAMKVVDAARRWNKTKSVFGMTAQEQGIVHAVDDYDAKHGK